jgi:outer membrane protein assembly factor BamB
VIASFGSYGFYCFDMSGNLKWEKDLGDMNIVGPFGEGTSPVLCKENLIILWDHQGQSKIYVLNKKTGEEIWQKNRDEDRGWLTPIVVGIDGKMQIIITGFNNSIGYDLESSDIIWKLNGLGVGPITCPVFDGERVFLMTGGPIGKKIIQAVNLISAKGNLNNSSAVIWTSEKNPPFVPSPLLKDGKLYFLRANRAQLSCVDANTGKIYYDAVKPEGMVGAYASPVSANGNIYMLDRSGTCAVIKEGTEFEVIALNKLDDNFDASPAIVGNDLLLRGHKSLYCISK